MSDDYHTCQAYIDPADYRHRYGYAAYRRKFIPVIRAVRSTRGQVITWQGQLIDPVYHSCCGGVTASAKEVWGNEVAYLQSVSCPYCTHAEHYRTETVLPANKVLQKLGLPADSTCRIHIDKVSASGRPSQFTVNGFHVSASRLREALNLPAARIEQTSMKGKDLVIISRGYGHGVGMCQYGADGMARQGYSYLQIIEHYYKGVKVVRLDY